MDLSPSHFQESTINPSASLDAKGDNWNVQRNTYFNWNVQTNTYFNWNVQTNTYFRMNKPIEHLLKLHYNPTCFQLNSCFWHEQLEKLWWVWYISGAYAWYCGTTVVWNLEQVNLTLLLQWHQLSCMLSGVHREIALMPQSLGIDTSLRLWWNPARSIIDSGLSAHRNFDHISCTAHKCGRMIQLLFCPRVTLPPLSSWAPVFVTYPSAQSGLIS